MRSSRYALFVAVITAVAAAIRFATLGRQSYWYDELFTVSLLRHGFGQMLAAIPRSEATPYLYYVIAWPWARLFGLDETGLRSLSGLFGAATVPVAYGAGAAIVSRRAGLIAAALVGVSPFLVWYSQEARAYSLLGFFGAATVLFFARALTSDRRALWWWALAASLALATHYFAIFVVAPEAVWLLARSRRRAAVLALLLPAAVQLAEIPLILAQRGNGSAVSQSALARRVVGMPKDLLVAYSFPAELAGSVAAAALVAVGIALAATRTTGVARRGALLAGTVGLAALVLPVLLAFAGLDFVIARNLIEAVVPGAIFVAAGYAASRVGAGAAVALGALFLAITLSVSFDARYGRTDWRGAGRSLGASKVARAIVVTPPMPGVLWRPYVPDARVARAERLRVGEVDVVGLATQGAFSARPLTPPAAVPRTAPHGFRVVEIRRTPTFVLIRYRADRAIVVSIATLARLGLSRTVPAGVLFQRRRA